MVVSVSPISQIPIIGNGTSGHNIYNYSNLSHLANHVAIAGSSGSNLYGSLLPLGVFVFIGIMLYWSGVFGWIKKKLFAPPTLAETMFKQLKSDNRSGTEKPADAIFAIRPNEQYKIISAQEAEIVEFGKGNKAKTANKVYVLHVRSDAYLPNLPTFIMWLLGVKEYFYIVPISKTKVIRDGSNKHLTAIICAENMVFPCMGAIHYESRISRESALSLLENYWKNEISTAYQDFAGLARHRSVGSSLSLAGDIEADKQHHIAEGEEKRKSREAHT